jgi:hypothetical protein
MVRTDMPHSKFSRHAPICILSQDDERERFDGARKVTCTMTADSSYCIPLNFGGDKVTAQIEAIPTEKCTLIGYTNPPKMNSFKTISMRTDGMLNGRPVANQIGYCFYGQMSFECNSAGVWTLALTMGPEGRAAEQALYEKYKTVATTFLADPVKWEGRMCEEKSFQNHPSKLYNSLMGKLASIELGGVETASGTPTDIVYINGMDKKNGYRQPYVFNCYESPEQTPRELMADFCANTLKPRLKQKKQKEGQPASDKWYAGSCTGYIYGVYKCFQETGSPPTFKFKRTIDRIMIMSDITHFNERSGFGELSISDMALVASELGVRKRKASDATPTEDSDEGELTPTPTRIPVLRKRQVDSIEEPPHETTDFDDIVPRD